MLKKEGKLPKSDQEDLPFNCTCLVGQTEPLDVDEFPQLKDPEHPFINTLGDNKPFTVSHTCLRILHFQKAVVFVLFFVLAPWLTSDLLSKVVAVLYKAEHNSLGRH